ncbi:MAG: hypothetical protein M1834_003034 [Cirrosporium novae-zelandiae]|nr:MAG: hypothetical protein M1834_003034 [Cirrosporium novae-zelandiae]
MFWRFGGYANVSAIDTLLDRADVTLEELLDETELVQELKQHNTKLIEYLRNETVLRRLFNYVIAPPMRTADDDGGQGEKAEATSIKTNDDVKEDKDNELDRVANQEDQLENADKAEKERLRFAYIASEVLSSETWSILEAMIDNRSLLREFWVYLKQKPPLDPLQASYFTKVNDCLLDKKTEETLDFLKTLDGIVQDMLQHVDCPVIMDLLLKIISLEKAEGGQGIVEWLHSQNLMPTLLSYLSPEYPSATQTSAGDFLKAIITISANASGNEQSCIGPNELTRQLVSESCVDTLISTMLKGGNPLTVGVGIVIEVIRKNNSDYDPDLGAAANAPPTSHDPIYLGRLLRLFAQHVPDFMDLMAKPKAQLYPKIVQPGPYGSNIEPLGFDRFKTCELMAELLHCSNMGLLNERGSEAYIKQRDTERERLKAEGALNPRRRRQSGTDFTEDSSVYRGIESSEIMETGPTEARRLEVVNNSEDDGFEDVTASGILSEDIKEDLVEKSELDNVDNEPKEPKEPEQRTNSFAGRSLDLSDEFVDEPLSSPPLQPPGEKDNETTPSEQVQEVITEKIGNLNLEDNVEAKQSQPEIVTEDAKGGERSSGTGLKPKALDLSNSNNLETAQIASSQEFSPHPEDTPAPLFASRSENDGQVQQLDGQAIESSSNDDSQVTINHRAGSFSQSIIVNTQGPEFEPRIELDIDEQPLVGDYLKMMFVEHKVVPTILDFFFRFPWNNFLHNVVYDVVQQVFNGSMDRGYNRFLAIDLFETGRITDRIVEGQKRSDEAQQTNNMRLGYMGHLTLIAEEVVKFSEKHTAEILSQSVLEKFLDRQWIDYVEQTLAETRERDNAILGGVRPDMGGGRGMGGLSSNFGNTPTSSALANAGLNGSSLEGGELSNNGNSFGMLGSNLLSGFGNSSDSDEELEESEVNEGLGGLGGASTSENFPNLSSLASAWQQTTTDSSNDEIPAIPPPPPPLNIPPSRARRQLAARLAAQQKNRDEEQEQERSFWDLGGDDDNHEENRSDDAFAIGDDGFPDPEPLPPSQKHNNNEWGDDSPLEKEWGDFTSARSEGDEDGDPFAVVGTTGNANADSSDDGFGDDGLLGSSPPVAIPGASSGRSELKSPRTPTDANNNSGFSARMAGLFSTRDERDGDRSSSSSSSLSSDDDDGAGFPRVDRKMKRRPSATVEAVVRMDLDDEEDEEMGEMVKPGDGWEDDAISTPATATYTEGSTGKEAEDEGELVEIGRVRSQSR